MHPDTIAAIESAAPGFLIGAEPTHPAVLAAEQALCSLTSRESPLLPSGAVTAAAFLDDLLEATGASAVEALRALDTLAERLADSVHPS